MTGVRAPNQNPRYTPLWGLIVVRRYNGKRGMRSNAIWFLVAGLALVGSAASQERREDPRLFAGPPSILKQCLDPGPSSPFAGPSSRARECTRQYCAEPAYRAKVRACAMSQPQSESEAEQALTCITRWEHDQKQSAGLPAAAPNNSSKPTPLRGAA